MRNLSLDLGSHQLKAIYQNKELSYPSQYVRGARLIIGDAFASLQQQLRCELSTPFSGAYPLNFDVLGQQLTDFFTQMQVEPTQTHLKLTLPPFTPAQIHKEVCELVFEQMGFRSLYVAAPAAYIPYCPDVIEDIKNRSVVAVLDAGFSQQTSQLLAFSTLVQSSIKRSDCAARYLIQQFGDQTPQFQKQPILTQRAFQHLFQQPNATPLYLSDTDVSTTNSGQGFEIYCPEQFFAALNTFADPKQLGQAGCSKLLKQSIENTAPVLKQCLNRVYLTGGLSVGAARGRVQNDLAEYQVQAVNGGIFGVARGINGYDAEETRLARAAWEEEAFDAARRRFW